jgi:hypothetical protein
MLERRCRWPGHRGVALIVVPWRCRRRRAAGIEAAEQGFRPQVDPHVLPGVAGALVGLAVAGGVNLLRSAEVSLLLATPTSSMALLSRRTGGSAPLAS